MADWFVYLMWVLTLVALFAGGYINRKRINEIKAENEDLKETRNSLQAYIVKRDYEEWKPK